MAATSLTLDDTDITTVAPAGTQIVVATIQRPLRPPMTRHRVAIPGRAGSWDFGVDVQQDYTITVELVLTAEDSEGLVECAAAVAAELDGEMDLVFDDDEDTTHTARVYEQVNVETEGVPFAARVTIVFECSGGD